jgi:hypothetical protein
MTIATNVLNEIETRLQTDNWSHEAHDKISALFNSLNVMDLSDEEAERFMFLMTKF